VTFSIDTQIAEVEREIRMRIEVYARQIANGKMKKSEADYRTDCMRAVLDTLYKAKNAKTEIVQ
jgi:hypothetical protein